MALLLLLLAFSQPGIQAVTMLADPKPTLESLTVPVPTNLTFEAYNLNTLLHWEYPSMHPIPVFTVQVKVYGSGTWVNACTTTQHDCNISSQIRDPSHALWARVKARVGQNESAHAESKEFILCNDGKVGPPKLNITQKEDQIIVGIHHPFAAEGTELDNSCFMYSYTIDVKVDENKTTQTVCDPYTERNDDYYVDDTLCYYVIPVGTQNSNFCVSVRGVPSYLGVATEQSQYHCVTISRDTHRSTSDVYIPAIVTFILLLISAVVCAYCLVKIKPCQKNSIPLPNSLVSVVKTATAGVKPESKYVSPVTYQPVAIENEKVVQEEVLYPATLHPLHPEDSSGKAERRELSSEAEVVTSDTGSSAAPPESSGSLKRENSLLSSSGQSDPCSFTVNTYHSRNGSDSGLVESGSFVSDSESAPDQKTEVKTEIQEPVLPRNTTTSFGYDRPHVLVDVLVGEGGKESLIGYRLTTESKEFT